MPSRSRVPPSSVSWPRSIDAARCAVTRSPVAARPGRRAELPAVRHRRRERREVRQIERPRRELNVEPVHQPRVCRTARQHDPAARDRARLRVDLRTGSSRISSAVTPPRVASASHRPLRRRLDRELEASRSRPGSYRPGRGRGPASSWSRRWATESGASSAATATSRTRRRSMASPPPPVVSADLRSTSSRSQRPARRRVATWRAVDARARRCRLAGGRSRGRR